MLPTAFSVAYVVGMLTTIWTDLREHRIPNWITGPLFLGGFFAAWYQQGLPGLYNSLMGVLIATVLWVLPFLGSGVAMGGGDQKLALAVGAALGLQGTFWFCGLSAIGAAILFVLVIWRESGSWRTFVATLKVGWVAWRFNCVEKPAVYTKTVPLAPVLAPAAILAAAIQWTM